MKILQSMSEMFADVPLVEFMYLVYLHACQVRLTMGNVGLCYCTCVTYFERKLTPLCVDSVHVRV